MMPINRTKAELMKDIQFLQKRITEGEAADIQRKQAEKYREMGREVVQILSEPGDFQSSIQRVLTVLKTKTGFDAVGIRLQEGDDFPYFTQDGFSRDFLRTENTLVERSANNGVCRNKDGSIRLECTCGLVVSGKTDPANPYFTKGGSCWTNEEAGIPFPEIRLHPRDECLHQGYASVALVPIRVKDKIVGLIQFNDRRQGCFTLNLVEILEEITAYIGQFLLRKEAEEELKESKALIDMVVENVPLMIFLKEATDLSFVVFNRTGEELLGYDRKSLLGKNNLDLFPPEQAAHFMAKDREVLDGEAGVLDIPEEPILTAKKGTRLLHTRKVCIRGADGKTKYLLGISEDITERRQAEEEVRKLNAELEERVALRTKQFLNANAQLLKEIGVREEYEDKLKRSLVEKELLLKEVNHRVKNNLQVVASILGLQIMQTDNEETAGRLKDAQERVNSMGLLQGMLHQEDNLAEINFEEYIKNLAANLTHSYVIHPAKLEIKINAPGVLLDINTAIPCGLIINEFMTNSLKHAFRDASERKIWLDCNLDQVTDSYVVFFRDNGIGLPDDFNSKKATTLGLQLIEGLTKQLKGTMTFQNSEGAQFTVTFPRPKREVVLNGQDTDTNRRR